VRVVLDTNVLVAAQRAGEGASANILRRVESGTPTVLVSTALFLEYEEVLMRAEHLAPKGATSATVERALAALAEIAVPVNIHFRWRPLATDSDDDMVAETAINGSADVLVTSDTRAFVGIERFGVQVMTPGPFWDMINP
jgi:putative PIN family toxin of toxin-antitoxin system